jgi:flotillin
MPPIGSLIITIALIILIGGFTIYFTVKKLLYICEPNEVLIFAGRHRKAGKKTLGYHVLKGGRGVRIPLLEKVYKLDLTNMVIPLSVRNAYSKGGIPLNLDAVANVKIAGSEPVINNAIERMLDKPRREIMRIVKETLEGNLRGVLATLTPEQVNEDKTQFQQKLVEEAEEDLKHLGLSLDTLNIQNISDDKGYLDSIGRKQAAEILKKALIAEASSHAEAAITAAENEREIAMAQIRAETDTAKAEADRRIIDATTRRDAVIAEEESVITAAIAKAYAEVEVQKARIEQTRRKLHADVVAPANAQMQSSIANAIGMAAKTIEDGKATANALRAVTNTWKQAGKNARDIFLLQKLDLLIKQILGTIQHLHIEQITLLPNQSPTSSDGQTPLNLTSQLVSASEQIKSALGVDIPAIIQGFQHTKDD